MPRFITNHMLERIKALFYRPEFFREQSFTLNQALRFYSLTVLVIVALMLARHVPDAFAFVQSIRSGAWYAQQEIVQSLYPEELKLSVDDGVVSTNMAEPVVIALPDAWTSLAECGPRRCKQNELPMNLLVIDTARPVNRADFEALDTVAILGSQEIGFHNPERGETRIFNLKEAGMKEHFTLTASLFRAGIEKGFQALQIAVVVFAFFIPGFLYVGFWIAHLVYSLFGALVVWLAATLQGHRLAYGRAYRSALYLLALPLLVNFLLTSFVPMHIPFAMTLALFIMAAVNFPKEPKLPEPVKIATTDTPTMSNARAD